jgi:hypothetical protein
MSKFKSILFFLIFSCTCSLLRSQISDTPYSFFGQGELEEKAFGTSLSMGGTGIAFKSGRSLNHLNPASYSGIDSMSFLYEFGLFGSYTQYYTRTQTEKSFNANIRYLAMGFRTGKRWAMSIGLVPYSSVNYQIRTSDIVDGTTTSYTRTFTGSGGINQFYWGNSFLLVKGLSVGLNASYIFGTINKEESAVFSTGIDGFQIENSSLAHGMVMDYGLQYSYAQKTFDAGLGFTISPSHTLSTSNNLSYYSSYDTISLDNETASIQLPWKFGIGTAFIFKNRIRLGLDYDWQNFSSLHFSNSHLQTRDYERYSMGVELIPSYKPGSNLFKRMYYRGGFNLSKNYLVIDKTPLDKKSCSLGLGIPIRQGNSMINVALEYGQNGTRRNGLIQENYWMIHLNLSVNDIWFVKRRFD